MWSILFSNRKRKRKREKSGERPGKEAMLRRASQTSKAGTRNMKSRARAQVFKKASGSGRTRKRKRKSKSHEKSVDRVWSFA